MPFDPYVDPDMITGIYQDPANEVLLAEYALATGGIQMGVVQQGAGGGAATSGGTDGASLITNIQGISGGGLGRTPGSGEVDQST